MPFDGVVVKSVVSELSRLTEGARIEKIFQPERDEIHINIRSRSGNCRLLLSANASYPRIHVTEAAKENPAAPPVFCMLLRKHLTGGRILSVDFHNFERIITINIESASELGDLSVKKLIIEIMGRHSNIILVNDENRIIDAIKHIDNDISSVREVMPAREYILPPAQDKVSPEELDVRGFISQASNSGTSAIEKYMLNGVLGFSPLLCREICYRAGIDPSTPVSSLADRELDALTSVMEELIGDIRNCRFSPCITYAGEKDEKPLDFHSVKITHAPHLRSYSSISKALDDFYTSKDNVERLRQKKSDLIKVLNNSISRCTKKIGLQQDKLREVADREKLQLYGELITANIYNLSKGSETAHVLNYYSEDNEYLDIPMDANLTPQENAQKYFKQYAKAKSAYAYTTSQLEESMKELEYLESVMLNLENSTTAQEIEEIRQELIEQGYMTDRRKTPNKKNVKASLPLRFLSSDGLEILVGRNNKQNDHLTLKAASSNDLWLHAKNVPGSHVIIRKTVPEIPSRTLEEAAILAAWHSKAKLSSNVQIDYTAVKNVSKPSGAKPGMVIYVNYKTLVVNPDEELVKRLSPND